MDVEKAIINIKYDDSTVDATIIATDAKKQTRKLAIKRFFNIASALHIQRKLNAPAHYKYAYILLDTNNIDPNLSSGTTFGWNLINFVSLQTGTISVIGKLRDIVGMRLYPVKANIIAPIPAPGKTWIGNTVNLNYNFTILIHEFQAQSYVGREGRKFHFDLFPYIMNYNYDALNHPYTPAIPYIEYTTSGKGNGWFWFKTPFTTINTITMSIGDPFDLLTLDTNQRTLVPIQLIYLSELDDN